MKRPPLFLGIDFGTSGVRACVIDGQGLELAGAGTPLPATEGDGDCREQQPGWWWTALEQVLDASLAQVDPIRIAALAVDGTSPTLLPTNARGGPLGPALMYHDGRARTEARRIALAAPPESAAHGATSGLAKLLHLQSRFPNAARVMTQTEWITGRLAGRFGICDANNVLKLGFDPLTNRWPDWMSLLDVRRELLPQVIPAGTPLGGISSTMARRFGLSPDLLVVAGTTDSTAAFIATGATRPGEAMTALGSTLVVKILSSRPVFSPAYGIYSQPLGELWLVGGGSNCGGATLEAHFNRSRMVELSEELHPEQPTGLDYYPLPRPGERFPVNDPALEPRLTPRPTDDRLFFQGLLEGIAEVEAHAYTRLSELGAPPPSSIRTTGGGANNRAWSEIRRRRLGMPLLEARHHEAAYGAALLARAGTQQAVTRTSLYIETAQPGEIDGDE